MPLTIQTNIASNQALLQLNRSGRLLARNFERVSSGLRISRAADDAAGLAVAESLRSQHRSAEVAARNINDGVSVIGVAEGGANEIANVIVRLRELAIQSASETLADAERSYIQDEADQLVSEIDRIANTTEFNGVQLINVATDIDVQVGVNGSADNRITISTADLTTTGLALGAIDLSTATNAQSALSDLDDALETVSSTRATFGAVENRLGFALSYIETFSEASKAAESRIRDLDFGGETAALTRNQTLQQAGISVLAQARNLPQNILALLQG